MDRECEQCGEELEETVSFCVYCGSGAKAGSGEEDLEEESSAGAGAPPEPTPKATPSPRAPLQEAAGTFRKKGTGAQSVTDDESIGSAEAPSAAIAGSKEMAESKGGEPGVCLNSVTVSMLEWLKVGHKAYFTFKMKPRVGVRRVWLGIRSNPDHAWVGRERREVEYLRNAAFPFQLRVPFEATESVLALPVDLEVDVETADGVFRHEFCLDLNVAAEAKDPSSVHIEGEKVFATINSAKQREPRWIKPEPVLPLLRVRKLPRFEPPVWVSGDQPFTLEHASEARRECEGAPQTNARRLHVLFSDEVLFGRYRSQRDVVSKGIAWPPDIRLCFNDQLPVKELGALNCRISSGHFTIRRTEDDSVEVQRGAVRIDGRGWEEGTQREGNMGPVEKYFHVGGIQRRSIELNRSNSFCRVELRSPREDVPFVCYDIHLLYEDFVERGAATRDLQLAGVYGRRRDSIAEDFLIVYRGVSFRRLATLLPKGLAADAEGWLFSEAFLSQFPGDHRRSLVEKGRVPMEGLVALSSGELSFRGPRRDLPRFVEAF